MQESHFKANIIVICAAIVSIVAGLIVMSKYTKSTLEKQQLQVNSLIHEIGDIEQKKIETELKEKIVNLKLKTLDTKMQAMVDKLDILGETENSLTKTQEELEKAKQDLDVLKNLNSSKDQKIATLSNRITAGANGSGKSLSDEDTMLDILILGTHGSLTDTIMTASMNKELKTVSLINFPRDLFYNGRRINDVYKKFGIEQMAQTIFEISGIRVERYIVFDMQSFIDVIDALEGIEINVEKDLYDHLYPGANYGYSTFYVKKGLQTFDGQTALKYARSRKTTSDFDRAKRQQQIVEAVIAKLKKLEPQNNIQKYYEIFTSLTAHLDSNIDALRALSYYSEFKEYTIERENILSTGNYLYSTITEAGAYILLPKTGNYEQIKEFIHTIIYQ